MIFFFRACIASFLCVVGLTFSSGVIAQASASDNAKQTLNATQADRAVAKLFAERFDDVEVTGARLTPYGIYEVVVGGSLIYTDEKVTWVMEGPLIDAATRRDVSRERMDQLGSIPFSDLPLELAVKQVRGDGSRQIAIFEDPNCGYCKQLHKVLKDEDNLTIYSFLYPILSPDSTLKSRNIWCAKDSAMVWHDWIVGGKIPPTAECDAPINEVLAFGKKALVRGTPAIFFPDGTRFNGAVSLDVIRRHLNP